MKRKKFKIRAIGYKNEIIEVDSTDYDVENGLIRFKTAVYDIRTGLWVCTLDKLKDGVIGDDVKVIDPNPKLKMTDMLKTLSSNSVIMWKIDQRRIVHKNTPTLNVTEEERTLFS